MKHNASLPQIRRAVIEAAEREVVYVPRQPKASQQATAFLRVSNTIGIDAQKTGDLRRHIDQTRTRTFLDDEAAKRKKFSIETGFDERTQSYRMPLEPWTGPRGSQKLYQRIMFIEPQRIADYAAADLPKLGWLRDEGLAGVDDDGFVRPLSDSRPAVRRAYPGAPVGDKKAKTGKSLMDRARPLVLAAIANLMRHMPVSKIGRRKLALADRRGGMSLSAYDITTEANAIKAKRPELSEYRYLSVSTGRKWINNLLGDGTLAEAEPPKAVRRQRSWRTLPRIFAPLPDAETAGLPPGESRR